MSLNQNHDVFLSYAREDIVFAQKLCNDLRHNGISVWFDETELQVGENWKTTIREKISISKFFLALISSSSINKKGFVQKEIEQAISVQKDKYIDDIFILPIRIDDCKISYPEFSSINYVDMFPDYDKSLNNLVQTIWKPKSQTNLEIVGFDLGHGETSVSVTRSSSSSPPQIVDIDGKSSIITAVAVTNKGVVIGEDAYEFENPDKLSILFKSYGTGLLKRDKSLKVFLGKLFTTLPLNHHKSLLDKPCSYSSLL
jgi:hypothetical protein